MALPAAIVLSGLPQDHFPGDLEIFFKQGTVLLKTPTKSPYTSPKTTSTCDSRVSSLSETDSEKTLQYYLDIIDKLEERFQKFIEFSKDDNHSSLETEIVYQNRNLLDLGSNLQSGWKVQHAVLQNGVHEFFEYRSVLSRLDGAQTPNHQVVKCPLGKCGFEDPVFF